MDRCGHYVMAVSITSAAIRSATATISSQCGHAPPRPTLAIKVPATTRGAGGAHRALARRAASGRPSARCPQSGAGAAGGARSPRLTPARAQCHVPGRGRGGGVRTPAGSPRRTVCRLRRRTSAVGPRRGPCRHPELAAWFDQLRATGRLRRLDDPTGRLHQALDVLEHLPVPAGWPPPCSDAEAELRGLEGRQLGR